jgi:protein-tyrosine phosphatase
VTCSGAALAGVANFRDIGGLMTPDGRRLRSGRLFRSASPQELTEGDSRYLRDRLGLRYVIDLRTAREAVEQGRGLLGRSPVCYLNVPLVDVDRPAAPSGQVLLRQYLDHLDADPNLPLAVETVASAVAHPTLLHCAAGKDRTGVVAALVELNIGIEVEQVVADYMATAANMEAVLAQFRRWPHYARRMAVLPAEIYRCEEHVIRGLVKAIDERYGGARAWALSRGVPPEALDQLSDRLLVSVDRSGKNMSDISMN